LRGHLQGAYERFPKKNMEVGAKKDILGKKRGETALSFVEEKRKKKELLDGLLG